ncbi:nacrein-like protein isoform X2 [Crassostrea angulata]|uniref:nacrein-like protein isoform X2 n=1 Tax=Magallana angulata TaxID=2784310 RepID=UPI0022B0B268|nr:nacrein-like protein isoform X2 [Crassostrea angulata]
MVTYLLLAGLLVTLLPSTLATSLYSRDRQAFGLCYEEDCLSAHFSYNPYGCHGPSKWKLVTPCWHECGGKRQSPVNIKTEHTHYMPHSLLHFHNLCTRVPGKIRNNGHSPHFSTDARIISLTNVPLRGSDKYIFEEIHFHIGKREEKGSEHSIDGDFYPMEAHMVFYNDKYKDIGAAKSKRDGLVVIGVMAEINDDEDEENPQQTYFNWGYQPSKLDLNKACPCVGTRDFVQLTEFISPVDVLPYDWSFYMYDGSLTTPPCYQTVRWIVMRCPIRISLEAFNMYKLVQDVHNVPLVTNGLRRPIQRQFMPVFRNFHWGNIGEETPYCPDEQ